MSNYRKFPSTLLETKYFECGEGTDVLTGFSNRTVKSTTDTLGVGTRKAIPVSLLERGEKVAPD